MEAIFIPFDQKRAIIDRIDSGDKKAALILIAEIDRLESIVKDYEIGLRAGAEKLKSESFKKPQVADFIGGK